MPEIVTYTVRLTREVEVRTSEGAGVAVDAAITAVEDDSNISIRHASGNVTHTERPVLDEIRMSRV